MASIFIRTIIIYLVLNVIMKIMGKRQIGELEVNELVTTLLISEIAAAPVTDTDLPLFGAVIPILFISAGEVAVSYIKNKSDRLKRLVEGVPAYIIYKGSLRQQVLSENRISINEILTEMRIQGIGDIGEIEYAILEQNGKISLFKKQDVIAHTLIADGEADADNLRELDISREELDRMLGERCLDIKDVFLMTLDDGGNINIIKKEGK